MMNALEQPMPGQVVPEAGESEVQPATADPQRRADGSGPRHAPSTPDGKAENEQEEEDDELQPRRRKSGRELVLSLFIIVTSWCISEPELTVARLVKKFPPMSAELITAIKERSDDSWPRIIGVLCGWAFVVPIVASLPSIFPVPLFPKGQSSRDGRTEERMWYCCGISAFAAFLCVTLFSGYYENFYKAKMRSKVWYFASSVVTGASGVSLLIIGFYGFDVFPFPCVTICNCVACSVPVLLCGYYGFPRRVRESAQGKRVFVWASAVFVVLYVIYGLGCPLIRSRFVRAGDAERSLWAVLFVFIKGGVNKFVAQACRKAQPDSYGSNIYFAVIFYETFLCTLFQQKVQWFVFFILVGVEMLENFYFILLLEVSTSMRLEFPRVSLDPPSIDYSAEAPVASRGSLQRKASGRMSSMLLNNQQTREERAFRRQLTVLSTALYIEMAEIMAPLVFLIVSILCRYLNCEANDFVAHASISDFWGGCWQVFLDIVVMAALALQLACVAYYRLRVNVIRLAYSLVCLHGTYFVLIQLCVVAYLVGALEHAFYGVDFTLQFRYLDKEAEWLGGNCWRLPGMEDSEVGCGQYLAS